LKKIFSDARLRLPIHLFFLTNSSRLIEKIEISYLGPSEVFAVIGANETLLCQANEKTVWWTKDDKNITLNDKR
jgi:hypothetical protein